MPNWCSNYVTLEHSDASVIDKVELSVKEGKLLNTFLPRPQAEEENWYNWNIANWGTKWDVGDEYSISERDTNKIVLSFDSAWSPPLAAYGTLQEQGFKVTAFYYEPGLAFCGRFDEDGEENYEFGGMSAQEIRDTIPQDLDEMFDIADLVEEWENEYEDEENIDIDLDDGLSATNEQDNDDRDA